MYFSYIPSFLFLAQIIGSVFFGKAYANTSSEIGTHLKISLKGLPLEEKLKGKPVKFSEICEKLGTLLTNNRGLWGTGPFQSFSCDAKSVSDSPSWELIISGSKEDKAFTFFYESTPGKKTSVLSYSIPTKKSMYTLFNRKNFPPLLAFQLSNLLPFRSSVKTPAQGESLNGQMIVGPIGSLKDTEHPSELSVFGLKFTDGIWQTEQLGKAKYVAQNNQNRAWQIKMDTPSKPGSIVFLQQVNGRDELKNRVEQILSNEFEGLIDGFLNLGRSAYIGVRYGIPISGDGVMKKSTLLGIFADLRSGITSGLKFNYDLMSKKNYSDELGTTDFGWSRFQIGYSFLKPVNWWIVSQIDATPRIGITSLSYRFVSSELSSLNVSFDLNRAPTIGLEVGAERNTPLARLRLWTFGTFSVGVLPIDKDHTTTSIRAGLDAYRDLFSIKETKFAILGFTAIESTRIVKKSSENNLELLLANNYLGFGATITW